VFYFRKYHFGLKLSHLKLLHSALGVIAYGVGVAAQVLGYYSNYYKKLHEFEWRLFMSLVTGLLGTVTFLFALKSLYERVKIVFQK
jgi:Eukaryotic cytochrome b561